MFLKKYEKNGKIYYLLTCVFQQGKEIKPRFEKCFLPQKLGEMLVKLGVEVKNEKD